MDKSVFDMDKVMHFREDWKDDFDKLNEELLECNAVILKELTRLRNNKPKNVVLELVAYKKLAKNFYRYLDMFEMYKEIADAAIERLLAQGENTALHNRKKWTKEEEELLIESVCDDVSISDLAFLFGRTPGAISSKISELVGLKRLSQDVVGKFIGTFDGKRVEGDIKGTVIKEETK